MALSTFQFSNKRYSREENFYLDLWQRYRKKVALKMVGSGHVVLDVGCYDGSYMQEIERAENKVYGIEASEKAVEKAKKKKLNVVLGDLEKKWPFGKNFFDVVFLGEVIEHIVTTDFLLSEIKRVLKPKGVLIVTTPNLACLSKRILLFLGKNPYQEASFTFPSNAAGHLREYTKDLLQGFVESKGFELVEYTSDIVSIPYCPQVIQRALGVLVPGLGRSLIMKFKRV